MAKKSFAILPAIAALAGLIILADADDFKSALPASYDFGLVIDRYGRFIPGWALLANVKRIRLLGTKRMDKAYRRGNAALSPRASNAPRPVFCRCAG